MFTLALRKTHIATSEAILLGCAIAIHQPLPAIVTEAVGVWLGCQLPDIDQKQTRVNKRGGLFTRILTLWGHRTWSHSIWIPIMLLICALYLSSLSFSHGISVNGTYVMEYLYYSIVLGYFLHEVEDSFSIEGIRWFYPLGDTRIVRKKGLLKYKVGGTKEQIILIVATLLIITEIIWIGYLYI
ncbi:metal-dependent hydrolase [Apilactobacillus bombintestini]|uniref:Metal-dependent hydrolase n=1 Tax=Apilactobacillus bombintestini TaxID=2419772 RepID=A0A387ATX5_9LACO|nr:metal-dependent hydrolase [Apilactobacillus bombintestini]